MTNAFEPPKSSLIDETPSIDGYGSIDRAVSGDYEFRIGAVLSEAWQKTKGAKWVFHLAFLWYFLVLIAAVIVLEIVSTAFLATVLGPEQFILVGILNQVLLNLLVMPMSMGLFMMGVRRAVNAPLESTSVFDYFSKAFVMLGTLILMYLMILIGFLLLVLPGIYLTIAYFMAMPLVVEKNLSPWRALEVSRKAVSKRWFAVFFFSLVLGLLITLSAIPLGIGLIWTIPMAMIAYGILYRNMFGVEAKTIA